MQIFNKNADDMVRLRRFLTTAGAGNANLITCVEDQSLSSRLRDDAHHHFTPATRLKQFRTGSIAALPALRSKPR
ncbi:hypothetical protein [Paludibaculum fermentans]|uniref:Uncharacterized protein n=1 Tax=Paludibaculum fermentans TaxID=1473598 RepID=A0A7S7NMY4_PALFE|nr:hypothetical protein [Paludibaculum fermentans]QOY86566.1 hypothetical protein IRI77_27765 [Paludibaculum fermentans]